MTLSIYDTAELVQTVQNLKLPSQFLVDTFFPNIIEYTTAEVAIDVDTGKRRLAPFVSPLVAGKPVEARKYYTNTFAPAYVKDKRPLDPMRPVKRAMGERIGGNLTPQEREAANLAFEIEDQVQMIQRRLEWMAASALKSGTVTITGEGYPTTVVNFNRDAALTITLTSTAVWNTANVVTNKTASPSQNLDTWATLVLQKSGAVVTDVLFTNGAWAQFLTDTRVQNSVWFQRGGLISRSQVSKSRFSSASTSGRSAARSFESVKSAVRSKS